MTVITSKVIINQFTFKAMRKVFNNSSQVIHLFAQKSQSEARCSNVYFETPYNSSLEYGSKLYSYGSHYLLAEFIDENTVMINDSGYSSTTSKHISEAKWALSQYKRYYVSETDLDSVYYTVKHNIRKLANARKPELYIEPILRLWETLNEFHEYNRKSKKLFKNNYTVYHDTRYLEIKSIVNSLQSKPEEYKERLNKLAVNKAKKEKRENKAKLKEALIKFNAHEINSFRIGEHSYLRLSECGKEVETSQQIKVGIKEAEILWHRIKQGKDIKGVKIGYYTVISFNGELKIGCHRFIRSEVLRFGKVIENHIEGLM